MADSPKSAPEKVTLATYPAWHKEQFNEDLNDNSLRVWYEINVRAARGTLDKHEGIAAMQTTLQSPAINEMLARNQSTAISFTDKPFPSLVDKIFRLNCNWNRRFPKEPKDKWLKCEDVFSRVDDLVRTLIVCRYIDGPERVCLSLTEALQKCGLDADFSPRATNDGYYAHHITLRFPFELYKRDGTAKKITMRAEIQVTTQMQDVLRDMTHVYYRQRRVEPQSAKPSAARWDFQSPDFRATYLGHTLHLIEGIVAELRGSTAKPAPEAKHVVEAIAVELHEPAAQHSPKTP
jgi:ppGpp synthetase/RelA/SpoT-type nucleotidyltranferase